MSGAAGVPARPDGPFNEEALLNVTSDGRAVVRLLSDVLAAHLGQARLKILESARLAPPLPFYIVSPF